MKGWVQAGGVWLNVCPQGLIHYTACLILQHLLRPPWIEVALTIALHKLKAE